MSSVEMQKLVEMIREASRSADGGSAPSLADIRAFWPPRYGLDGSHSADLDESQSTITERFVNGVRCEDLRQPGSMPNRTILYLHGGAYVMGSPETHRELAASLSTAARCGVHLANYRLAPEHPFPAAIEDATRVYRGLLELGYAPNQIAVAGDSAGGGLALAMLVASRDAGLAMPAAVALFSPWTDLSLQGKTWSSNAEIDPDGTSVEVIRDGFVKMYLGDIDPRTPEASPLFGDLHGLPPMLVHAGSIDRMLDDSVELASRAESSGVEVRLEVFEGAPHVWQFYARWVPEGKESVAAAGAFLHSHL
jgi:acetyl esterase/lipase